MFTRDLTKTLLRYAKFPVVAVLGPRQSGRTTLVKNTFKEHKYLNLENPQQRAFASTDPSFVLI